MRNEQFVQIEGVTLRLAHPDQLPMRWVGQDSLIKQLLACWLVIDDKDIPLNPRLIGKPGVGENHSCLCSRPGYQAGCLYIPGYNGYPPRRFVDNPRDFRQE